MPDANPRRSALGQAPGPDDPIRERRGLWIQRLYAPHGLPSLDLPEQANRASEGGELSALWVAPWEWLLVGETVADISDRVADNGAALSDLSHARTVFRVEVALALEILAQGCPLDLRPDQFMPGHCAQSVMAGVSVLVHYLSNGEYMDIYVARSYGQFMYDWLRSYSFKMDSF